MLRISALGAPATWLCVACVCSVAHCGEQQSGKPAIRKSLTEQPEESHGIWYTAGIATGYGSRRPDKGKTWKNICHVTSGSKYSHNHVKVVYNGGKADLRVIWSYGDSHHPPATRNVYLYRYGESLAGPKRMSFPSSCIREPVTKASGASRH